MPHGTRNQQPAAPDGVEGELHELAEGEDLGAAQLIGAAIGLALVDEAGDRFGHVAHEDGREFRLAAADQRQERRKAGKLGKAVEERILRPEDDRRAKHDGAGEGRPGPLFALGLAAGIFGGGVLVGADGRHLDEDPRLRGLCGLCRGLSPEGVDGVEVLRARRIEHAREVDHGIGALAGRRERGRIAHIGLHHHDLAGIAERLQVARKVGPAAGDADAVAAPGQRPHDVPADEARTADDGDESVGRLNEHGGHPDELANAGPFSRVAPGMQR